MQLNNRALTYILIIILALVSFGVYLNSLHGGFLIDDQAGILNNQSIHNVKTFFSRHFTFRLGILTEMMRVFIWQIAGGQTYFFHLFNVLMHIACTILFFILCNILFKNINLSFLSALIFAVHPMHTEAVSWISGGPYVFSSVFFIAAMIFYIKADKSMINLSLSLILFGLCVLTASVAATFPLIAAIYELFFREKKEEKEDPLRKLRLFAVFLLLLISLVIFAVFFLARNKFIHTIFYFKGSSYLIVVTKALAYYLKIIYLPLARGLYHPFAYTTVEINKVSPAFFAGLGIILVCMFLFFRCLKKYKAFSFGIGWFFITYLPYSNIIPVCNIISERYMYLPLAGFSIFMAALFIKTWEIINKNDRFRKALRITAMLALVLYLLSYSILTIKRNRDYSDIITYWETNINNFPEGYMAYNNLAGTYYVMGNFEQALAYSWITLMINKDQPHVWCNLGKVYREKGDLKMAQYCYEEALKVDKGFLPAQTGLIEVRHRLKADPKEK